MFFFFPDDLNTSGGIESPLNELNDIILYQCSDGNVNIEILFQEETFCKQPRSYPIPYLDNKVLKEFIIKGFVLDDVRLKQGKRFGKDYFDELLERIREIRASERRFYEKITDIYAQCSIDYIPNSEITIRFYQTVQNKLHWAITGKTAPEIIADRADSNKHMELQTWKNAPDGKILQSDTLVAKNYLQQPEIKELERIVSMYLDYAENQAARQIPMKMQDWIQKLDAFLQFNEYEVLQNAGKITRQLADESAKMEYQKFRVIQDRSYLSDFDKEVKKITQKNKKK